MGAPCGAKHGLWHKQVRRIAAATLVPLHLSNTTTDFGMIIALRSYLGRASRGLLLALIPAHPPVRVAVRGSRFG
jgi:hypothetical protein